MGKVHKRAEFTEFVTQHHAQLRGFLRVIGVAPDSVDDLAQETFLVAYRELEKFDKNEDFGKWLRGIARNLTRNELRKNARRTRILSNELTGHLLAESEKDNPEERFDEADFCALRDCLEQLPEKSRHLISGRYADEWKAPYLADQFNMSATAVRLSLMRIRQQLKSCITKRLENA